MRAPEDPFPGPPDGGRDAASVQGVGLLLVEPAHRAALGEALAHDGHRAVRPGRERHAVVRGVGPERLGHGERREVELAALRVGRVGPEHGRALRGVAVGLLPGDGGGDGVHGLRPVGQGQVGHDEGVPVPVDLRGRLNQGAIHLRRLRPSRGGQQIWHREVLLVDEPDGACAGRGRPRVRAGDVLGRHLGGVDLLPRGRHLALQGLRLVGRRDHGAAVGEVVADEVVLPFREGSRAVVAGTRQRQAVQDDGAARDGGGARCERQGRSRLLRRLVAGGVQHVDEVDGADALRAGVVVGRHHLAEGVGRPVVRLADGRPGLREARDPDGHVDGRRLSPSAHQVDGRRADVDRHGLGGVGCPDDAVAQGAVRAVLVFAQCLLLTGACAPRGIRSGPRPAATLRRPSPRLGSRSRATGRRSRPPRCRALP